MAMTAGTVTIDSSGDPNAGSVGTMARAIYDVINATVDYQGLTGSDLQNARQPLADLCNAIAAGVVGHIVANADIVIKTGDSGLQRIPAVPVSEDDLCKAPASDQTLTGGNRVV